MKVKFSKALPYTPAFNGNKDLPEVDQLRTTLRPIKTGELIDIMDVMKQAGFQSGSDETSLTTAQMRMIVTQSGNYLPGHVEFTQGNEDFNMEDVISYQPYLPLATELLFALINASSPNEDDVKN